MGLQNAKDAVDEIIRHANLAKNSLRFNNAHEALWALANAVKDCTEATIAINQWSPDTKISPKDFDENGDKK